MRSTSTYNHCSHLQSISVASFYKRKHIIIKYNNEATTKKCDIYNPHFQWLNVTPSTSRKAFSRIRFFQPNNCHRFHSVNSLARGKKKESGKFCFAMLELIKSSVGVGGAGNDAFNLVALYPMYHSNCRRDHRWSHHILMHCLHKNVISIQSMSCFFRNKNNKCNAWSFYLTFVAGIPKSFPWNSPNWYDFLPILPP